ncbi:Hypothetical predicted protein [Prunus dulcis]|uniref:Uncharacterized protein n=1 Tax=Prunus dulcis TaxID=3755 RepID=A0A5E4G6C3_PRUDU|nr:Hypothetical predicted protein [Prunus dulcis]
MGFGSWWPKSLKHWLGHMGVLSVVVKFPYICEEDVQKEDAQLSILPKSSSLHRGNAVPSRK